jgi:hypothetical protein
MSAIDVLNVPVPKVAEAPAPGRETYPGTDAYVAVVGTLLERCKIPGDVLRIGTELGRRGGWREEFELYHQAESRFPGHKEVFQGRRQNMATSRRIKFHEDMEIAGARRVEPEELLRVGVEA